MGIRDARALCASFALGCVLSLAGCVSGPLVLEPQSDGWTRTEGLGWQCAHGDVDVRALRIFEAGDYPFALAIHNGARVPIRVSFRPVDGEWPSGTIVAQAVTGTDASDRSPILSAEAVAIESHESGARSSFWLARTEGSTERDWVHVGDVAHYVIEIDSADFHATCDYYFRVARGQVDGFHWYTPILFVILLPIEIPIYILRGGNLG